MRTFKDISLMAHDSNFIVYLQLIRLRKSTTPKYHYKWPLFSLCNGDFSRLVLDNKEEHTYD